MKFYLPDGSKTDIVALSLPLLLRAHARGLPRVHARCESPIRRPASPTSRSSASGSGEHPEAGPAIQAALGAEPPESYATVAYNSIHSFRWTAPDGTERWVRYRFEPEEGERTLSEEEARARGRDYLQEEIAGARRRRLPHGRRSSANDGDDVDDPTVAWPYDRERVEVGRLELTGPETEREQGDDILVFDPTRVTDGIGSERRPDPALPAARVRGVGDAPERRAGAGLALGRALAPANAAR